MILVLLKIIHSSGTKMLKYILLSFACTLPIVTLAAETPFTIKAKNEIKDLMKDPESTQFRNIKEIVNTQGNHVLCGQINSKNSYGGYVGFKPFSYSNDGLNLVDINRPRYEQIVAVDKYEKDGCEGERLERLARNPEVYKNYCAVFYQLFTDVIADGQPRELALENAMKQYKEQSLNLIIKDEKEARIAFESNLQQMEQNPATVKMLTKKKEKDKMQYLTGCSAITKQAVARESN